MCNLALVVASFDGIGDGTCIMWKNSVVDSLAFLAYFDSIVTCRCDCLKIRKLKTSPSLEVRFFCC
jgi:hypothetical protein